MSGNTILFLKVIFISCLGFVLSYEANAQSNQVPDDVEYQALKDLYDSTNGAGWTNNTNWLTGTTSADFATWFGVTVIDGDVAKIALNSNNLVGKIPESIGNLTGLQLLHLGKNRFNGYEIPESIGNLLKLSNLYLKHSSLRGQIPSSIGNLLNLRYLNLTLNLLEGPIPSSIGNLEKMIDLRLDHNKLTSIPESFSNLVNLDIVYLNNNYVMSGPLPSNIGNLTKVRYFNVSKNALSGTIPPSIATMVNAGNLLLNNNQFSGTLPPLPDTGGNLNVDLSFNKLEGNIPDQICSLQKVHRLNLSNNNLTGVIPSCIGSMKGLSYLYLINNSLTGVIPTSLTTLPYLRHLKLDGNDLSGEIPAGLFTKTLNQLTLSNNHLTGELPNFISSDMQYLYLNNNKFTGPVPVSISNLSKLIHLRLYGNEFTSFPSFLSHPLRTGLKIEIQNNQFNMSSIRNNFTSPGLHPYSLFTNSPQQIPANSDTIQTAVGQSFSLQPNEDAADNIYQWQKIIGGIWTDIYGANEKALTVPSASFEDAGTYRCKVTNDWVTGMVIYSSKFLVLLSNEFWSVANGNWTTDNVWSFSKNGPPSGYYPQAGNKVFIVGNHITLSNSLSCGTVEVIVENKEASLTVDGAEVTVHGEVRLTKSTEGYPGNIKVVNGGKVRPVNP